MITISQGTVNTCTGVSRRDFLRVGGVGLGSLGLSLADLNALPAKHDRRGRAVILLMLVGGPSQLETWDPKPDAPRRSGGPSARLPPASPEFGSASICRVLQRGWIGWHLCVRCITTPRRFMRPGISFCKPGGFAGRARNIRISVPRHRDCSRPGRAAPVHGHPRADREHGSAGLTRSNSRLARHRA